MKKKIIGRRRVIKNAAVAGLVLLTISFTGTVHSQTKMKEVRIGAVYPMTGPTGSFGEQIMRGWRIAVEEVNAEGGIKSLGGAKIETDLRDTEGNPRIGMAVVEKIARDKEIPLIVGCWSSTVTFPVTQVSEQYGLPHIIDIAGQTEIMTRGFKYVFRYCANTEILSEDVVNFVEYQGKKTGRFAKRSALMTVDDNFGRTVSGSIRKAIERTDQKVVAEIMHPLKVTNVDVEVAKIKAANPDVIYLTAFLTDAALITRALRTFEVNPLGIMTIGGISNPEFIQMTGNMAQYFFGQQLFDTDLNMPHLKEFDAKLMKLYGIHGNAFCGAGYGLVYLIKDVLERAGTIDREKVREALAATNITTGKALTLPGPFIRFDQKGENIGGRQHICQVLDGEWHTVWPHDMPHKHEAVWPMPKWQKKSTK